MKSFCTIIGKVMILTKRVVGLSLRNHYLHGNYAKEIPGNIPDDIEKAGRELDGLFTQDQHIADVKEAYVEGLFAERSKEIDEALAQFKSQLNNEEKAE